VPKITIIMRKSYGQAYINMGGGRNCDEFVCWPTADLGFMDPAVGANVLVGDKSGKDARQVQDAIAQDTSAWGLAELYEAQTVIDPRDTRAYLIRALETHRMRMSGGVGKHLLHNWPTSY
jgi:acetyl-CoA carboxylase carboxyltransferase component